MLGRPHAVFAALALVGAGLRADPLGDRAEMLYRPFQAEQVALSSDGKHVAYTRHTGEGISIVIMEVDNPSKKTTLAVQGDRDVAFSQQREASQLRLLRWASANRLVFAPTEQRASGGSGFGAKISAPIFAADADGKNASEIASARDFASFATVPLPDTISEEPATPPETAIPTMRSLQLVALLPGDPAYLFVEGTGTGDLPTTLFKVDVATGKISTLAEEQIDGRMLYDWQGHARIVSWQVASEMTRTFSHLPPTFVGRWQEMNEKWGGPAAKNFTLSPANYYGERSFPLGFDFDGKTLYYASNVGHDTFGIYGFNTETRQRTAFAIEHPNFDLTGLEPAFPPASPLVFDERRRSLVGVRATGVAPLTMWVDPELAGVQRALEKKFPRRTVELLEWDEARKRFLLRVTGGVEPGRYFIYRQTENLLVEFLRRAPWLRTPDLQESSAIEFDTRAGVHLTGYLTLPRKSRLSPPPLLVYFPSGFPAKAQPEFDRDAQMLAGLGFIVLRVNYRGSTGFGARHRNAIQEGIDRVPLEDVLAATEWLAPRHPFDRRRIVAMGEGFGGYLALRALELRPEFFRCAVGIDAPLDLDTWLRPAPELESRLSLLQEAQRSFIRGGKIPLAELSVLRGADKITRGVFLMVDPDGNEEIIDENNRLRSQLKRLDRPVEYFQTPAGYAAGVPEGRAKAYRQLEGFFNENLYNYKVNVGETIEVK